MHTQSNTLLLLIWTNSYQLNQNSIGYYEILSDLENLLINDPKMDKTTLMILSYIFNQMRSESPDQHSCPDYLKSLIQHGYKKNKKNSLPIFESEKENN